MAFSTSLETFLETVFDLSLMQLLKISYIKIKKINMKRIIIYPPSW